METEEGIKVRHNDSSQTLADTEPLNREKVYKYLKSLGKPVLHYHTSQIA